MTQHHPDLPAEQEFLGIAAVHDGQADHADDGRCHANSNLAEGEPRILTGDRQITCGDQPVATTRNVPTDLGDYGDRAVHDCVQNVHEQARAIGDEARGRKVGS